MFRPFIVVAGILLSSPLLSAFDPASQDDSQALLRHFYLPSKTVGPPLLQGSFFDPHEGETLTLMGGADVFRMQDAGYFEAMLQSVFADRSLQVRNIGWSSDTVYRQQRPMFFFTEKGDTREGSVPDRREKIQPGVFLLFFGKMESLEGEEALPAFEETYRELLSGLRKFSQRIVVVSPISFPAKGPATEMAGQRNEVLKKYAEASRRAAEDSGAVFFDLEDFESSHFESNGMYLSESGHLELATRLVHSLGIGPEWNDEVLAKVLEKNRLWDQYYRPTNWAFLYGDRQHVPSSRDHVDNNKRWFEEELKKIPGLIAKKETEIWKLAEGVAR
ncbi:MAG: GDSL-type esterase/lipase family protein [Verrucomicrobiales bacterium]|nr:GDSL-type esterase/lipase family protein [Verrucomicrobiales bacterium]